MQNIYEEYALLDAQKKEITVKQDQLKAVILEGMNNEGETKKETGMGNFSISRLKKWTYPEAISLMEIDFKAAKAKTESTGEATFVEKDSLRFTGVKL